MTVLEKIQNGGKSSLVQMATGGSKESREKGLHSVIAAAPSSLTKRMKHKMQLFLSYTISWLWNLVFVSDLIIIERSHPDSVLWHNLLLTK